MRGLYIHIPFCKHICSYCDFPKIVTFKKNRMEEYIDNLIKELDTYKNKYQDINTVYIGGGTPNALPIDLLTKLLNSIDDFIKDYNIIEYSIECNPELLSLEQVTLFKRYNVNRISLGVQSFNDDILKKLGRHHNKKDIIRSVSLLKENDINNINIDLIFNHPFDNLDLVKENLNAFYDLDIPHVSYYSMILEDKTVFNYLIKSGIIKSPDEDKAADLYEYIINDLNIHGYKQYEISNFSKNKESVHNKLYWQTLEYIGIGLGASGYLDNIRYNNSYNFNDYYNNIKETEELSTLDKMKEYMMMSFRLIEGPSKKEFLKRFNKEIYEIFKNEIDSLKNKGLIIETKDNYKLTHQGLMLANIVFMEFV